jgi:hypothetical protein
MGNGTDLIPGSKSLIPCSKLVIPCSKVADKQPESNPQPKILTEKCRMLKAAVIWYPFLFHW